MFRGNVVMKGYFKNQSAVPMPAGAGSIRVILSNSPDGYVQLKDRSKDIIISGGENISSIEVEDALFRHPAVAMAAVVAMPHEKWGETPCAYIEFANGASATVDELRDWCKQELAGYKVPGKFVFAPIPKTSTGKVQKFVLREQVLKLED